MMWRCNSARRRGTAPPLPRHGRGAGWNWLPGSPVARAVLRPRARTRPRRDRPPAAPAVNDRQAGVLSPTQGTVSAGELVSEGFTDLRTDLPRQETTRIDMHQMRPSIVTRAARGLPPLEAVRRPRARPQQQPRRSPRRQPRWHGQRRQRPRTGLTDPETPGGRRWAAAPGGRCDRGCEGRWSTSAALHRVLAAPCRLRRGLQARVPDARAAAGHRHAVERRSAATTTRCASRAARDAALR